MPLKRRTGSCKEDNSASSRELVKRQQNGGRARVDTVMADLATCPPFTPASVKAAHDRIASRIQETPLLSNDYISSIASTGPRFNIFFKCENLQRVGCFKVRGAFNAVQRLIDELGIDEVRTRGLVTHSSGNHAQSLALASALYEIPAYIVMPSNAAPSKIAGTRRYCSNVILAGTNPADRQAKVAELVESKHALLVPPYDHPDIVVGQGTVAYEISQQYTGTGLRAILTPCGGGGLLGGTATWFSDKPTYVFGAEPSFEGANDAERGLVERRRIETVTTTTIADGLRTPIGAIPWEIVSDSDKVQGVYSVSEEQIKDAMRLIVEHLKVLVEPSSAVPLAVVLYNEAFRQWVTDRQAGDIWDIAIVLSGGNTTVDAIKSLF